MTLQRHYLWRTYASGFSDIDDTNILSGNDVAKTFEQSQEKIVKIRQDALLLFSFKSRTKGMPDLNATIKFINAILGNWYGYTIKSSATRVGSKEHKYKKTYWIDCKPYSRASFDNQEELMDKKLHIPDYLPIVHNTILEYIEHNISDLPNNAIDEKDLFLEMPAQYNLEHRKNSSQDICHADITTCRANAYKKKISEFLIFLSSEFLIKNETDVDILIFHLQQKLKLS
ncbi:helicase: PROVISIONAL [Gigaspora margarita]|uniref:Helicase: PROVISIONAL n=1 Tax=Gigaspora margarita TaxID=4874 RepID=A0A8H4A0W9_GIGMA|nr:helicase: PROVISIONAL [Gigaspora margarita]